MLDISKILSKICLKYKMPKKDKILKEVNLEALSRKFSVVTKSKDSIQNLSSWIIRNVAFRDKITEEWLKAIRQADMQHRLTLFYLANDVLQNCKRRNAAEYRSSFAQVLENALSYARDEIIRDEVLRLIFIWRQRNVFSPSLLKLFQDQVDRKEPIANEVSDSPCLTDGEMLENFNPNKFIASVRQFNQPRKRMHEESGNSNVLTDNEICQLNLLDIRINCDVHQMYSKLEATSKFLEEKIQREQEEINRNVKIWEIAQTFYSSQYDDVRRVTQAYKIFGKKLNKVKDALSEKMKTLQSPIDIFSPTEETALDDKGSPSLGDKTYIKQKQQDEDQGIAIETHLSFFDQGMQFSSMGIDEIENKGSKSTLFRGEEERQTLPMNNPLAQEIEQRKTASSVFKTQTEFYPSKELGQMSPKHKKLKIDISSVENKEVIESSPMVKIEAEEVKFEKPNSMMAEVTIQEMKHQLKELNQEPPQKTPLKTGSVSKTRHQPKMSHLVSPNIEVKTEESERQPNKLKSKLLKQEVKTENIEPKLEEIDLTLIKKCKTEIAAVEQKSKELDIDLEIIPLPKLEVEASRKSFKPIKLNLISPSKPNNKERTHQPKGADLELLSVKMESVKVEHEPDELSQGLAIKMTEVEYDLRELNQEDSFSKIQIKSEKIDPEEPLKIPLINDINLNIVQLESEIANDDDDDDYTSTLRNGDDKSIELQESGKSTENFPSIFKQTDEETLNMIFREDEVPQTMNVDEPIKAYVKTESSNENSKLVPVSVSSTILPNMKQVSVPSNIPPSTKQCLLKSMKTLNLLLSKKKVDSKMDSADQQTIFSLNSMFPIYSHNLRSEKSKCHPAVTGAISASGKLVQGGSKICDIKNEKVDTNLELMDMDLDSEDDN